MYCTESGYKSNIICLYAQTKVLSNLKWKEYTFKKVTFLELKLIWKADFTQLSYVKLCDSIQYTQQEKTG